MNNYRDLYNNDGLDSPILATKYAHIASSLIQTLGKKLILVIGLIFALVVISLLDTLYALGYASVIPDAIYDSMITIFSVTILATTLYLLNTLLRSKRMLSSWADTFERNSIKAGMNIAMANKSKEEAIHAIAQTVEQIGEPLRKYISSKENYKNFLDADIKFNNNEIFFDILIDQDHVKDKVSGSDDNGSIDLKQSLQEYGSIVIKFTDGTVDKDTVKSFYKSLSNYVALTKNKIGLAVIVGDDVSEDAYKFAKQCENDKINYIILIEKPLIVT
ncbi:MAG: hypothetical protein ICV56_01215 [Nitrososphaeraceae archaeon]|nr:hypothetical protein [Nitrososphaeraceae archaeon]